MNNKGFMMAEVVVVSSIILVTLVGLYASYNKLVAAYNKRIDYYDVATLYKLANFRDNVTTFNNYYSTQRFGELDDAEKIYYLRYRDLDYLSNLDEIRPKFKDYLLYLKDSISISTTNMLVMERCVVREDKTVDIDNCKYAYLEVFS